MFSWKLDVEYEGTRYKGWQMQPHARTIQGELIKACEDLLKMPVEIGGAGRTDAGVHALNQVAHLKIRTLNHDLTDRKLQFEINDRLPHDINILRVQTVAPSFHARHNAVSRHYLYRISTRRTALAKPFVWWIKDRLDTAKMQDCCKLIIGRRDFASFCEASDVQESTVVAVDSCALSVSGSSINFRIEASHFLWKMVRRIVGALAEVGRGKVTVKDFERLFEIHNPRAVAALTAPPSGLFLEKIVYPPVVESQKQQKV